MLKVMKISSIPARHRQCGVAAIEFAIIAILLFTLLFGIVEFGRLFYVFNSVQEVTRRGAREAVVRWIDAIDDPAEIEELVLLGHTSLPGGGEITAANIKIEYLNPNGEIISPADLPGNPAENISECLPSGDHCIAFVQVSIVRAPGGVACDPPQNSRACYTPLIGLFPFLSIPIPASTVTMPTESMGYTG